MQDLNQFAISKILGSTIKQIGPVGFGHFSAEFTAEEIQNALRGDGQKIEPPAFGYEQDAVVVQAFEAVREGAPTDELLWNKDLARSFVKKCRETGLTAPYSYLIRRLINVRKSAPRYQKHGIVISPTTRKEAHPSIVPEYAHVIEFALVKLRYRYGSSIDDILMDDALGDKFEELADRYLYISHNRNIQSAIRQFGMGDAFGLMAITFWKPKLEAITLSFAAGRKVAGASIETWERKLIHDLNPVFNWPMPQHAA